MAAEKFRESLSALLSDNDSCHAATFGICNTGFFISCDYSRPVFLYPYCVLPSVAKMEKTVGVLRVQRCGSVKKVSNDRHCLHGIFPLIGGYETAVYPNQAECGELVDSDYRDTGIFVFPL